MERDISQELLDGIAAIKAGDGKKTSIETPEDVRGIREKTGLSQNAFAGLLDIMVNTRALE